MQEYHAIILCNVTDLERFFDLVDECQSEVKMQNLRGEMVDIRRNIWIRQQLIWTLPIGRLPKIELYFRKREEGKRVFRLLN